MIVGLLGMMGISIVGGIILAIANIVSGGKVLGENHLNEYGSDEDDTTGSSTIRVSLPETIIGRIATLSTTVGKAASTGRMRTTMATMTATTGSGTRGSSDSAVIQLFNYSVVFCGRYGKLTFRRLGDVKGTL